MDIENKPYSFWAALKNWWNQGHLSKDEMWGDFPKKALEVEPYAGDAFKAPTGLEIIKKGQQRARDRQALGRSNREALQAADAKFLEVTSDFSRKHNRGTDVTTLPPTTHQPSLIDDVLLNPLNPLGAVVWAEVLSSHDAAAAVPDSNQTVVDSCPAPAIDNSPAPSYESSPSYDPPASTYDSSPSYDNSSSYDSGSNTVDSSSSW